MPNKKLFLLLFVSLLLRISSLGESLWLDEATSIKAATLSFGEIITKFSPGDFHPPLYYLLLKIWIGFFGSTEFSVRLLSVIFGIGTVYLTQKVTSKLFKNENLGYLSAFLLAISPLHIYYSQEARMYSMAILLTLLTVWFFTKIWTDGYKIYYRIGFVLSSALLLYTNYLSGLILLVIVLVLVLEKKHLLLHFKFWSTSFFAIFLLFLPWLSIFLHQIQVGSVVKNNSPLWWNTLGHTTFKELALVPIKFMIGRISFDNKFIYITYIFIASLFFLVPLTNSLKHMSRNKFVWYWLLLPLIITAFGGVFFSGFSYFRLIFALPAFYILVSFGLLSLTSIKLKKLFITGIIFVNLLSILIYVYKDELHREDWRSAVSYLEEKSKGEKTVSVFVTNSQRDPYLYYAKSVQSMSIKYFDNNMYDKVWLFRYVQPIFDPTDSARRKIELLGFKKVDEKDFNGVTVWEYAK